MESLAFTDILQHIEQFDPLPKYFDHESLFHGSAHSSRVMIHSLQLGMRLGCFKEARLAFFAAMVHDMARKGDGICSQHGLWAADTKLPLFIPLFRNFGLLDNDIPILHDTISWHSLPIEMQSLQKTTAILKDADALDRIRLGNDELNPAFLRFKESKTMISFAEQLFFKSQKMGLSHICAMLQLAKSLPDYIQM